MKTAISVRESLFKRAENFARKKKISRSQLFADAVEEYLDKREMNDLATNLKEVYAKEDSSVDPVIFKMALLSLPKEEW